MRYLKNDEKAKIMEFDNVSDFKRYLDKNKDSENTRTLKRRDSWTGVYTWEDFETYLQDGNSDITADVKKHTRYYIDKFEDKFATMTHYQFDVVGEFFDIGAVMVGEPEAWIKEIEVKEDKFIELNIQGTYPHNEDIAKVQKNGSKVFAIASILEKQGYLVRINMVFRQNSAKDTDREHETHVIVKVKDYDMPLDYKKFGIVLGVPFFRRGVFRLLEIEYGNNLAGGYGRQKNMAGDIALNSNDHLAELEKTLEG